MMGTGIRFFSTIYFSTRHRLKVRAAARHFTIYSRLTFAPDALFTLTDSL